MRLLALAALMGLALACGATASPCDRADAVDVAASDAGSDADAADGPGLPSRLPAFPLRAQGRWIVGADGVRFKLSGVNWQAHH